MLNAKETEVVLEKFFGECLRFWRGQGKEEREAFEMALKDVEHMKSNPYVPYEDPIDMDVKEQFIKYREMDLGR